MTGACNFPIVTRVVVSGAHVPCAAVEKSSPGAQLGSEPRRDEQFARTKRPFDAKPPKSRNETTLREPLWNGPRLRPAFVTQILSQAFFSAEPDPALGRVAYTQYGNGAARGGVFDERV
jgi:hypothetical protein